MNRSPLTDADYLSDPTAIRMTSVAEWAATGDRFVYRDPARAFAVVLSDDLDALSAATEAD